MPMPALKGTKPAAASISTVFFLAGFLWSHALHAQDTDRETPPAENAPRPAVNENADCTPDPCPPKSKPPHLLALIDKTHAGISTRLEATVKYADRFFADDNVFEETNKSYARLPLDVIYDQDDGLGLKIKLRARINLPNTNKRIKLLLTDANSEDEADNITTPEPEALQDNNFSVSLETQLKETGKWKVRPSLGLKTSIPPDPFARLRLIRYFSPAKKWLSRFSATGTYLAMAGAESDVRVQFSRAIREDLLFRSTTRWKWTKKNDYSEGTQIFSFFQHINEKVNVSYEMGIFSNDKEGWLIEEYSLWHRYRRLAYKNWLFIEIKPELRFKRDNDYDPSYRITFRVEPVFGKDLPRSRLQRVD